MKKYLFAFIFVFTAVNAQSKLEFDKRFIDCENTWVAFQKNDQGAYPFGFIYVDAQAGLTFHYEGDFKVSEKQVFIPKKLDENNLKYRLDPSEILVAIIPEDKLVELQIDPIPEWLDLYKTEEASIENLYRRGFMYNAWNQCEKALTYLEKAATINPRFKGLIVELGFSFNCLKQYDKAERLLAEEIKVNSSDAYVSKEYIYVLTKLKKVEAAVAQYNKAKTTVKDRQYDAENCFNIMQCYYNLQDAVNFKKWFQELSTLEIKNQLIRDYADQMNMSMRDKR